MRSQGDKPGDLLMRSNVSISGIRLGRHCHETLLLMVALSDVCTFSYLARRTARQCW